MATTVREFVTDAYQLISASSPTATLYNGDLAKGIKILNRLLNAYAATGMMITVAKTESVAVIADQATVTIGPADYIPTPDIITGKLSNLLSAWLELDNVSYPLEDLSEGDFNAAQKYVPLAGVPAFVITDFETEIVTLRLYPKPSQAYTFYVRGKFQLTDLTSTDTMVSLPDYYYRYLAFALARDLAVWKGRIEAWTPPLENLYKEAKENMLSASEYDMTIRVGSPILLNGANRVRAGI